MVEVSNSIDINRPPAEVFRFIAVNHARNHPRWDPGILNFRQSDSGAVGRGTSFTFERKMMGRMTPFQLQVTEFEPDRRFAFQMTGGFKGNVTMQIDPAGTGSRLDLRGRFAMPGLARLFEPMMKGNMSSEIRKANDRVRQMIEAGG
jgi:carbon monoxide dehydrogenase subunit G